MIHPYSLIVVAFACLFVGTFAIHIFEALQADNLSQNIHNLVDLAKNVPLEDINDAPILHHALNLYFGSQKLEERKALASAVQVLVGRGVDVNQKYGRDPDVLFKSLVLREMGLAQQIAEAGYVLHVYTCPYYLIYLSLLWCRSRSILADPLTMNHLYALPCDPIPLSKLLLHAEVIVEQQRQAALDRGLSYTAEDVVRLLAGATVAPSCCCCLWDGR